MVEHYEVTGRRTLREAGTRFAHLDKFFQGSRAGNITTTALTKYQKNPLDEGVTACTVNIEIALLRKMLGLAVRNGKLARVPHVEKLTEAPTRSGFLEEDQFRAILRYLSPIYQAVAVFAYITGWRVDSEVLTLTWPQVDLKGSVIRLEPGMGKTGEPRIFPITLERREILEARQRETERVRRNLNEIIPFVFHYRNGKRLTDFRRPFKTAARRAGFPWAIPHDFRRSAVRNFIRQGIPERVAMKLLGHKSRSVFDRYNIVSETDLHEAGIKLTGTFQARSAVSGVGGVRDGR